MCGFFFLPSPRHVVATDKKDYHGFPENVNQIYGSSRTNEIYAIPYKHTFTQHQIHLDNKQTVEEINILLNTNTYSNVILGQTVKTLFRGCTETLKEYLT